MISVLIVDDEKLSRNTLRKMIPWNSLGISEVYEAGDGKAGLDIALGQKPAIIISDIKMPHMNGLEMAEQIRAKNLHSKLLFLSGYTDKEYLKGAIHLHVDGYIEKPLNAEEITSLLSKLVREYTHEYEQNNHNHYFFRGNYDGSSLNENEFTLSKVDIASFRSHLKDNDSDGANSFLDNLYKKMQTSESTDPDYIKNSFGRLALCVEGIAESNGLTEIHDTCNSFIDSVGNYSTLSSINEAFTSLVKKYFDAEAEYGRDHVSRIHKYIKSHYSDPNLSISDIAKYMSFNATYLSTIYKQNTGRTINNAITSVRIDEAKKLLAGTDLKLYQVGEKVGYRDGKYFTRIFTKESGISPRDYRERRNAAD